jgi:hypothetical protein
MPSRSTAYTQELDYRTEECVHCGVEVIVGDVEIPEEAETVDPPAHCLFVCEGKPWVHETGHDSNAPKVRLNFEKASEVSAYPICGDCMLILVFISGMGFGAVLSG